MQILFLSLCLNSYLWGSKPVYFFVSYNTNFFFHWTPAQRDTNAATLLRHIKLMESYGIKANYYFTGLAANYLYEWHPELLDTLQAHNIPYSHHGANRPPHPAPVERVLGLNWEEDVKAIQDYEQYKLLPGGSLDTTQIGGLKKMRDVIFGTPLVSTGRFFEASILYVTKQYGAKMAVGIQGNTGAPSNNAWFLGILNRPDSFAISPSLFIHWALYGTPDLIGILDSVFAEFYASNEFTMISFLIHDSDLWASLPSDTIEIIWAHYDSIIAWAVNKLGLKITTLEELYGLVIDDRTKSMGKNKILEAADSFVMQIESSVSPVALPLYITVGDEYLSLADMYQLLLKGLSYYNQHGVLPDSSIAFDILGPTKRTHFIPQDTSGLPGAKVVEVASSVADSLSDRVFSAYSVFTGMDSLDAGDFLYLMAQVYRNIYYNGAPGVVNLHDLTPIPKDIFYDTLSDTLTHLQFWTYKPARWLQYGVEDNAKSKVQNGKLEAHPNPFTQKTVIKFKGKSSYSRELQLQIYNLAGLLVKTFLILPHQEEIVWDGKNNKGERMPAGIYFVKLKACEVLQTKKLILLR